jgi:uncharacterized protein (DUF885 family)
MILKLREDYKAHAGSRYSLRGFHDTLLGNGTVPVWLHPRLDARCAKWRHARIADALHDSSGSTTAHQD